MQESKPRITTRCLAWGLEQWRSDLLGRRKLQQYLCGMGIWERNQEFKFDHVICEMPIKHWSGNINWAVDIQVRSSGEWSRLEIEIYSWICGLYINPLDWMSSSRNEYRLGNEISLELGHGAHQEVMKKRRTNQDDWKEGCIYI